MSGKKTLNEECIVSGITYTNSPDGFSKLNLFPLAISNK